MRNCLITFAILLGSCPLCAAVNAATAEKDALYVEIFSVKGQAEVCRANDKVWIPALADMAIYSQDEIKTGADATVELAFDEDKVVAVNPSSHVVVLLNNDDKIKLIAGEVFATIKNLPRGSSFVVRTPTAIAGARGTDWLTRVKDGETEVEAYEESPFIRGIEKDGALSADEIVLKPGLRTVVPLYGKPAPPIRSDESRINRWRDWKGNMEPRLKDAVNKRKASGKRLGGDVRVRSQDVNKEPLKKPSDVKRPDVKKPDLKDPEMKKPSVNKPDLKKKDLKRPDLKKTSKRGSAQKTALKDDHSGSQPSKKPAAKAQRKKSVGNR